MDIFIKEDIIKDKNLRHQEVYLLLHLINLADENGEITISNKELMKEANFTNSGMLIKYIDSLVINDYIKRVVGGGAGHKNTYRINKNYIKSY